MKKKKKEVEQAQSEEITATEQPRTNAGKRKADGTWGIYPKSISRIETLKHSAWYVRIYFQGAYVRKTFSDKVYDGQGNALREALKWRDDMEKRMGKPRTERSVRKKTTVGDRTTGIYRRNMKGLKRGKTYFRDVYEVIWTPEPGKVSRTTISVTKYGEEEAYRMALAIRREKERQYFGGTIS
jgi:hypothetical protein